MVIFEAKGFREQKKFRKHCLREFQTFNNNGYCKKRYIAALE